MSPNPTQDSATLAEGQQVITACAVLNRMTDSGYEIMVARRAQHKKFLPGKYELPGGHIDFGEELVDGLKRELSEELGIRVTISDIVGAFTYMNKVKRSHSIEVIYLARLDDKTTPTINLDDHSELLCVNGSNIHIIEAVNGPDDEEFQYLLKALNMLNGDAAVNPGNASD